MKRTAQMNNNHRETSLDLIRGTAVLTMMLAHVVAFVHNMSSPLLRTFQHFGDTVSFTLFLLISGAASYYGYIAISDEKWYERKNRLQKRLLFLLGGYYLVAIISSFPLDGSWITKIVRIFLFIDVPGYTEFLIPFILFGVSIILFRKQIQSLISHWQWLVVIGLALYAIGTGIYYLDIPSPFHYYTSLFAGYIYFFRFPLFQYAIVFILGLLIGLFLKNTQSIRRRVLFFATLVSGSLGILTLAWISGPIGAFPYELSFQRWPPTFSFMAIGLLFASSLFVLLHCNIRRFTIVRILEKVVTFWGKNAFVLYIIHIVLLQLIDQVCNIKTGSRLLVIGLFSGIIIASSALTVFFNTMTSNAKNSS